MLSWVEWEGELPEGVKKRWVLQDEDGNEPEGVDVSDFEWMIDA